MTGERGAFAQPEAGSQSHPLKRNAGGRTSRSAGWGSLAALPECNTHGAFYLIITATFVSTEERSFNYSLGRSLSIYLVATLSNSRTSLIILKLKAAVNCLDTSTIIIGIYAVYSVHETVMCVAKTGNGGLGRTCHGLHFRARPFGDFAHEPKLVRRNVRASPGDVVPERGVFRSDVVAQLKGVDVTVSATEVAHATTNAAVNARNLHV
eukprot:1306261-Pyramimonas_sp.AAC.1